MHFSNTAHGQLHRDSHKQWTSLGAAPQTTTTKTLIVIVKSLPLSTVRINASKNSYREKLEFLLSQQASDEGIRNPEIYNPVLQTPTKFSKVTTPTVDPKTPEDTSNQDTPNQDLFQHITQETVVTEDTVEEIENPDSQDTVENEESQDLLQDTVPETQDQGVLYTYNPTLQQIINKTIENNFQSLFYKSMDDYTNTFDKHSK